LDRKGPQLVGGFLGMTPKRLTWAFGINEMGLNAISSVKYFSTVSGSLNFAWQTSMGSVAV